MSWLLHARRAVSFILVLKGMVGFSVAALALFGVAVPYFGYEATAAGGTAAAGVGALVGAVLAIRG
ncbi:hypothetical protein ACFOYU_11285 [Microvirga sp. GCM10011540]